MHVSWCENLLLSMRPSWRIPGDHLTPIRILRVTHWTEFIIQIELRGTTVFRFYITMWSYYDNLNILDLTLCFMNEIMLPLMKSRKERASLRLAKRNFSFFAHSMTDQVLPTAHPQDSGGSAALRHVAPRILERALPPSAAKMKDYIHLACAWLSRAT